MKREPEIGDMNDIDLTGGKILRGGSRYNDLLIEKDGKIYIAYVSCACNSGFWYLNVCKLDEDIEEHLPDATRRFIEEWRRS
jgi:hypothetical protein